MRSWSFRVVTFLFMLSMVATPFAVVNAQNEPAATPVEEVIPTEEVTTPAETVDGSDNPATPDSGLAGRSDASINAEYDGGQFVLAYALWDDVDKQVSLQAGFYSNPDIQAGDTIRIWYPTAAMSITGATIESLGITIPATAGVSGEYITLTFEQDFNPNIITSFLVHLEGEVNFAGCEPGPESPVETTQLIFRSGNQVTGVTATGEECAPTTLPFVMYFEYSPLTEAVQFQIAVPDAQSASGAVITIQYPADRMLLDTEPYTIYGSVSQDNPMPLPVGTAVAADGVITITFDEFPEGTVIEGGGVVGYIPATMYSQACDPAGGYYMVDTEPLYFYANPGGAFYSPLEGVLCNAAPAAITGELSGDGTQILWTIDTGHLINGGGIYHGSVISGDWVYDCETLNVVAEPGTTVDLQCDVETQSFYVDLLADGPARATITITSNIMAPPIAGFYLNCVSVVANGDGPILTATTSDVASGHGGSACAQVFPEGGGDFITNEVSAETVYPGQPLTYVVNVDTSVIFWWTVELHDILPEGFEVSSIACNAEPASLASDTCEVLDDNSVTIGVYRTDYENQPSETASLSLTIEGTVTAAPGTQLESVACFERRLDVFVPILPILDIANSELCDSALTKVIAPPATPTETSVPATPTETTVPATPTETSVPATPTETSVPATPTETTVPVEKQTTVCVEMWDGSGIEGATWNLTAPLASQTFADPYLTGVLDANNSTVLTDLPAGDYLFEVTPNGLAPQEFRITISDQSEEIVLQFAQPAGSATPGATPAPADPTQTAGTSPVTGLPETGNNASPAGVSTLLVAIAAAMMVLMAVGARVRSSNR